MPLNIPAWRRTRDVEQLKRLFSRVELVESHGARNGGYITVPIKPLSSDEQIGAILEDLKADREVLVDATGTLIHGANCGIDHQNPNVPAGLRTEHEFTLHIEYPTLFGAPKVWVTATGWGKHWLTHPHRYLNGSACLVSHADPYWGSSIRDITEYVEQACIWVAKTELWIAIGAKPSGIGWIGSQQSHDPVQMLTLPDRAWCPCGSRRLFVTCCKPGAIAQSRSNLQRNGVLPAASLALAAQLLQQYDSEWIYGLHHLNLAAPCPRRGANYGA